MSAAAKKHYTLQTWAGTIKRGEAGREKNEG